MVIYVLRQETPVFHPIGRDEVAARERLAVTAPDNGYPFEKQRFRPVPDIAFELPEVQEEPEPAVKGKAAKTKKAATNTKNSKNNKKKSSVKVITEEVRIVK